MSISTRESRVPEARPLLARLGRLWLVLRHEGPKSVARAVLENAARVSGRDGPTRIRRWYLSREAERFDRRHGTETTGFIDSGDTELGAYEASDEESFVKIVDSLLLEFAKTTFVDVGCGKGKAALLASRYPFREVVGVEYSEELCRIARRNVTVWSEAVTRVRIEQGDATKMALPDGALLVYLFNPFGPRTLDRFLRSLRESLDRKPRAVVIAYYHALWSDVVDTFDSLHPLGPPRLLLHGDFRAWANQHFFEED